MRRRQKSIKYDNERISLLNVYNKLFPLMENCMEDMKTTQKCKTKEDLVVFTLLNKKWKNVSLNLEKETIYWNLSLKVVRKNKGGTPLLPGESCWPGPPCCPLGGARATSSPASPAHLTHMHNQLINHTGSKELYSKTLDGLRSFIDFWGWPAAVSLSCIMVSRLTCSCEPVLYYVE